MNSFNHRFVLIALLLSVVLTACMPIPPADDNGEVSFVRQAVAKILGRKPKGSEEVQVLVDIDTQFGRAAVTQVLMRQPEYLDHWTDVIVDMLRVQREGERAQDANCFGEGLQPGVTQALATYVRDNGPAATSPPGGAFNMTDLIRSSLLLDDLSPIYRVYPIPLGARPGFSGTERVGDAFNHAMLNRQIDCLECHNSEFSTTNSAAWKRTWAIPVQLESAVWGPSFDLGQPVKDASYPILRSDQFIGASTGPWGMVASCGVISLNLGGLPARTTEFAGISGQQKGLVDLAQAFKTGSDTLKTTGLVRTNVPGDNPTVSGDQGYAYMVAMNIADRVWQEVMGSPVTIANYYPRNADQQGVLWHMTEGVFSSHHWSLRSLITETMTTGFFNRRAPDVSLATDPYVMQMVLDPWVQHDPRLPDPTPDSKEHYNGQGEVVQRYSPRSLLHSVAAATGWPEPKRFPTGADFPTREFQKEIGQYVSDAQQGTTGVDFQGLLSWESQLGVCQKPTGFSGDDWIDRLNTQIPIFDAANAGTPLTVRDVVGTMKDWFVGDPNISSVVPLAVDPANPPISEEAALSAAFGGVSLNTQASSVTGLPGKLRSVCGVLLQTSRFMLSGIEPQTTVAPPRLRVCNAGPCTYQEMCQTLIPGLAGRGVVVACSTHSIQVIDWTQICPPIVCKVVQVPPLNICDMHPHVCQEIVPWRPPIPVVPTGCPACGLPWVDLREPVAVLINVPGGRVLQATHVDIRPSGVVEFHPLKRGELVKAGDALHLVQGSELKIQGEDGLFATPKGGMPGRQQAAWTPLDRSLLAALQDRHGRRVDKLLKDGANPNVRDAHGQTALMRVVALGEERAAMSLIESGADVAATDPRGLTAVDFARSPEGREIRSKLRKLYPAIQPAKKPVHQRAELEEPWLLVVAGKEAPDVSLVKAGDKLSPAQAWVLATKGQHVTHGLDVAVVQRRWKENHTWTGGEAGPRLSEKQRQAALDDYMKSGFALEHPQMKLQKQ